MTTEGVGAVIVAAGYGSFRRDAEGNPYPKILEPIETKGNRSIIHAVFSAVQGAGIRPQAIVLNPRDSARILTALADGNGHTMPIVVHQEERRGAADAIRCALPTLCDCGARHVVVIYGDMPLWSSETIRGLVERHVAERSVLSMVSVAVDSSDDPRALERYGRVLRDQSGRIIGVVEPGDATQAQLFGTRTVNPSLFVFSVDWLAEHIPRIPPRNKEDGFPPELNTPELVRIAAGEGVKIVEVPLARKEEALGVNSPDELDMIRHIIQGNGARYRG